MNIEELELAIASKQNQKNEVASELKKGIETATLKQSEIDAKTEVLMSVTTDLVNLTEQLNEAKLAQVQNNKKGVVKMDTKQKFNELLGKTVKGMNGGQLSSEIKMAITDEQVKEFTIDNNELIIKQNKEYVEIDRTQTRLSDIFIKRNVPAVSGTIVVDVDNDTPLLDKEAYEEWKDSEALEFKEVSYSVKNKGGRITVDKTLLLASEVDLGKEINKKLDRKLVLTENQLLIEKLNAAQAKTINSIDDLSDLVELGLPLEKDAVFVISRTAKAQLNKLRDEDGEKIFTKDATARAKYQIFGVDVLVVEDTVLGTKGQAKGFYASTDAVALVVFAGAKLKYEDTDVFVEKFGVWQMMDSLVVFPELAHKLTFDFTTPAEPEV